MSVTSTMTESLRMVRNQENFYYKRSESTFCSTLREMPELMQVFLAATITIPAASAV